MMRRATLGLAVLLSAACDGAPQPDVEVVERGAPPGHHFRVDSAGYTLRPDGEAWTTSIGYVFRNSLPDTIHVVHCNGAIVMSLLRRAGDGWEPMWHGMSNACLSPAIRIAPGDSLTGRIEVWAALPGHPSYPTFESDSIDGEYRLSWHQPRLNHADGAPNFGDTLTIAQRTSETFRLARAASP